MVGPLSLSQKKKACLQHVMSPANGLHDLQSERQATRLRSDDSSHVAPVHKRPNQDAALQILLKDSFACRRGGGIHQNPLNSHRSRPRKA